METVQELDPELHFPGLAIPENQGCKLIAGKKGSQAEKQGKRHADTCRDCAAIMDGELGCHGATGRKHRLC